MTMFGRNTVELNTATMKAALQMYFDAQFADGKAPRVDDVKAADRVAGTYTVTLISPDAASTSPTEDPQP